MPRLIEATFLGDRGRYELRGAVCRAERDCGLPARIELERILRDHREIDAVEFAMLEGYAGEESAERFLIDHLSAHGTVLS